MAEHVHHPTFMNPEEDDNEDLFVLAVEVIMLNLIILSSFSSFNKIWMNQLIKININHNLSFSLCR